LLISGPAGPKDRTGIWVVASTGNELQKLRDDAWAAVPSPDGSRIAFTRARAGAELWVMTSGGEQSHRVFTAPAGYGLMDPIAWSADGRRLVFGSRNRAGTDSRILGADLDSGGTVEILSEPTVQSFTWARDGRLVYTRLESRMNLWDSNLWEVMLDARTMRVRGKPRRLSHWTDFNCMRLDMSADGKRLSFIRDRLGSNVYLLDLVGKGVQPPAPQRLTVDRWIDWPSAWTPDGRSVLFHSNRNGALGVFRRTVENVPGYGDPILPGEGRSKDARISPDGRWILYIAWTEGTDQEQPIQGRLMRKPISGGVPQMVFPVSGHPGPAADENLGYRPVPFLTLYGGEGNPRYRCPSVADKPCVLSEKLENEIVFTAFDPLQGKKNEVARIGVERSRPYFWDLSPDGRRIAFGTCDEASSRIRIVTLSGEALREISVKGWTNLGSVSWAIDGNTFFAAAWASKGSSLLRISPDGEAQTLYRSSFHVENPVASPDGRKLAFGEVFADANVWLLDHLR